MNKKLPILLGLFLSAIAVWSLITPMSIVRSTIMRLNDLGYDLQLKAHLITQKPELSPDIAIIDIDDKSLEAEGRWPWDRNKLANLVDELQAQGVVVIAFDMFFPEKEPNLIDQLLSRLNQVKSIDESVIAALKQNSDVFDQDAKFAKSLARDKVVLAIGFLPRTQKQNIIPPPILTITKQESAAFDIPVAKGYIVSIPELQEAAGYAGFINIFADTDGILRHAPLVIEYNEGLYPSLALQAVLAYLGTSIELITPKYGETIELEGLKIGRTIVPTNLTGQSLIPFIGHSYTFPYFSATDVLHKRVPQDALLGKIVFIGTSATGLGDLKATAIQNPFPGVEIQASMANGILMDNFSYRPGWTFGANLVLTILFGIISSFAFPFMGPRSLGAVIIFVPISMLLINNWIWEETGLVLSFLVPILLVIISAILNILWGYLFETRKRERLKEMFGQYVPEDHIDEMLVDESNFALHGEDRDMSVLFADIRGFTSISEKLTAAQLVEMLNTFFTPMTKIIFDNRGTIDKYVGDLIMAFWGAPLIDEDHAKNAIESALGMQEQVDLMQDELKKNNWPEIQIGIGINSGVMSVGDMGSQYRRNYTVLGDNVNLGSRVEGLTKFYGAKIIVTESTQYGQSDFVFRKLDRVRVKGKKHGIEIFDVLCRKNQLTLELEEELKQYHAGLDAYFAQKWDEAYQIMHMLKQQHPGTKIYDLYVERIEDYKHHPVPEDWDGVYVHVNK